MEIDTGAARSIISDKTYTQLWFQDLSPPLKPTNATLKTYTGEQIKPLGAISVQVEATKQNKQLGLLIVPGDGASLLGRDWLRCFKLDWTQIHHLNCSDTLQAVLGHNSNVFESSGTGTRDNCKNTC